MSPKKTAAPQGSEQARRAEVLRAEIRRHDLVYYNEGRSEVSDAEYDALFRELKALEEEHPELGAMFLLFLTRKCQKDDPELSGAIFSLFAIRKHYGREGE